MGGPNYAPSYYHNSWWVPNRPMPVALPPPPPQPMYGDHQHAKKVRNDVIVHKDTVKVELDEDNPDHHLVSFVFDALFDGSITIFYFVKEEIDCKFVPVYTESYVVPVRVPFQKGVGQSFRHPSGICMCTECAKALRLQSNKCPIFRQHIEELMEIKINYNVDQ